MKPLLDWWVRLSGPLKGNYILLRAMYEAFGPEFKRLGVFYDESWPYKWVGRIYALLVFALVLWLAPTGSRDAIFSGLLAMGIAWLVAVPLATARLTTDDLQLLEQGLARPGKRMVEVIERYGIEFKDASPAELARAGRLARQAAAYLTPVAVIQLLLNSAVRAAALSLLAFIGLVFAPELARLHFGPRDLGLVLLALCAPVALRLLVVLTMPLILQLYLAALSADMAMSHDQAREPMRSPRGKKGPSNVSGTSRLNDP